MFREYTGLPFRFGFQLSFERNSYSGSPAGGPNLYAYIERRENHVSNSVKPQTYLVTDVTGTLDRREAGC